MAVLLRREPWVERVLMAEDADEAARQARRHRLDVAIVDVSNAGPFVAEATAALRAAHPSIELVLTSRCPGHRLAPAFGVGAAPFLPATATSAEIVATVRAAAASPRDEHRAPRRSAPGPDRPRP